MNSLRLFGASPSSPSASAARRRRRSPAGNHWPDGTAASSASNSRSRGCRSRPARTCGCRPRPATTRSEPVMPPPPGTFSMMICWPSVSPSAGCRMRASVSIGPPAANGTIMVIGRFGQSCAAAGAASAARAGERQQMATTHESSRRCLTELILPRLILAASAGTERRGDMMKSRHRVAARALLAVVLGFGSSAFAAETYPTRTITILTPFAAGSRHRRRRARGRAGADRDRSASPSWWRTVPAPAACLRPAPSRAPRTTATRCC